MNDPDTPFPIQEAVSPYSTQRRRYKPKEGDKITVDLPGERIRAEIKGVVNEDAVVCLVINTPIAKTPHGFAKGDTICVRRGENSIGLESWVAMTERELEQRAAVARFEETERLKDDEAERARIAGIREADMAAQDEAEAAAKLARTPWYKRDKGAPQS